MIKVKYKLHQKNNMEKNKKISDSPHVIALPPLIYIGGLILGLLFRSIKPLEFFKNDLSLPLGVSLIIISIILVFMSIQSFSKAHTNVDVRKPTTSIVKGGPYRFSRNPIYLSMTILYLGITIWLNDFWLLIMLAPVVLIIQYGVIKREEIYLTRKFGETYIQYKKSVRRWL